MKLFDLLFDRRCMICDAPIKDGAVCHDCQCKLEEAMKQSRRTLRNDDLSLEATYLFDYADPTVQKLLFALKKYPNSDLVKYASSLYERAVGYDFCGIVTNCPRGKRGYTEYGFDQVSLPCKIMCKNSDGRMEYMRLLKRHGASLQQKKLTKILFVIIAKLHMRKGQMMNTLFIIL